MMNNTNMQTQTILASITRTIAKLVENEAVDGELSASTKEAIVARVAELVDRTDTPFLDDGWSDPLLKRIIPLCVDQAAEQLIEHARAGVAENDDNPASAEVFYHPWASSQQPRLWPCIFNSCARRTNGPH